MFLLAGEGKLSCTGRSDEIVCGNNSALHVSLANFFFFFFFFLDSIFGITFIHFAPGRLCLDSMTLGVMLNNVGDILSTNPYRLQLGLGDGCGKLHHHYYYVTAASFIGMRCLHVPSVIYRGNRACRIKTPVAILRYKVCCQGKRRRAPGRPGKGEGGPVATGLTLLPLHCRVSPAAPAPCLPGGRRPRA